MGAALYIVRAQGVEKAYVRGDVRTEVLRGVGIDVPEGSFSVLVGPSGCGKSTLLNLVGGLDVVDRGELTVAGCALHASTDRQRRAFRRDSTAFIFQFYQLIPTLTASENVEVVLEPLGLSGQQIRERAVEHLSAVGLGERLHRFPAQLSGGEQQRVAIARALAKRPRIVLADEPTGGLDRANSAAIVDLMRAEQQRTGTTFFVVTHDPVVQASATHLFEMVDGQVERR